MSDMDPDMDGVTITRTDHGGHGEYRAHVEGSSHTGVLAWSRHGDVLVAARTGVPPEIGGRGVAGELVKALIADARQHGFRIDPQCSYVAAQFARHPEWADLRA